jgi:P27 family predicted phage terminase small subunit
VWLTGEALKEWNYIAPKLEMGGVLSDWDRNALAAYCKACASYVEAVQAIERISGTGRMLVRTSNGNLVQNPLIGVKNKALENMRRLGDEFGLTPSSRARIVSAENKPVREDAKAKFFRAG